MIHKRKTRLASTVKALCCLVVLIAPLSALPAGYDHSPSIGPAKGWLMIHGGGAVSADERREFVSRAGGPDANFVFIPTAASDSMIDLAHDGDKFANRFGVKHVAVLHTRDRKIADSKKFVEPLRHASGVWFEGGRQWRLADAYLGTRVEREIKALLARGGVVGGSSAGATIQGSFLVRGDAAHPGNPDGDNRIMMVPGHEAGFALLPGSAIDQHVLVRHREDDLDPVIAAHPDLLGIGIDQGAAILVHGDTFKTMDGEVLIHDGKKHGDKAYYILQPGETFNLRTRSVER
ncbi:MAG: cyanophycinase [Candidatus Angelobacter sp.]